MKKNILTLSLILLASCFSHLSYSAAAASEPQGAKIVYASADRPAPMLPDILKFEAWVDGHNSNETPEQKKHNLMLVNWVGRADGKSLPYYYPKGTKPLFVQDIQLPINEALQPFYAEFLERRDLLRNLKRIGAAIAVGGAVTAAGWALWNKYGYLLKGAAKVGTGF